MLSMDLPILCGGHLELPGSADDTTFPAKRLYQEKKKA